MYGFAPVLLELSAAVEDNPPGRRAHLLRIEMKRKRVLVKERAGTVFACARSDADAWSTS